LGRKKLFILIIAVLILFILIGITSNSRSGFKSLSNIVSVPFKPVVKLFNSIGDGVSGFFNHFGDIKSLKEENKSLKNRIQQIENENEQIVLYKKENIELRKALKLIDYINDGEIKGANIIAKNTDNWYDIFTIDIGSNKGAAINTPVVNAVNALVGRVYETGLLSSKVLPVTDPESRISGMLITESADIVKITGDYSLQGTDYCKIVDITDDIDISAGDIVQTSGLGGIYPKGIAIGKVEKIYKNSGEIHREALLKIFVKYKELDKVFLIIEGDK
jgi:rod shape-determining protein MreC